MLSIAATDGACRLDPDIGGSIAAWTVAGQPMLRTAAATAAGPLDMASFPLVPYSNRIAYGRFDWRGERIALAANLPPGRHAIHGVGWQRRWTIAHAAADTAVLALDHRPDADWPWPFAARQAIVIADRTLTLTLSVTNKARVEAPLAFGHHPYFDAAGATLGFVANKIWLAGADDLPVSAVPPSGVHDFSVPRPVAGAAIDNCYAGWSGTARIAWAGRPFRLDLAASANLGAAVLFTPPGADSFCFEPVPHVPDAINRDGMPVVAPGGSFVATIVMRAVAVDADG